MSGVFKKACPCWQERPFAGLRVRLDVYLVYEEKRVSGVRTFEQKASDRVTSENLRL